MNTSLQIFLGAFAGLGIMASVVWTITFCDWLRGEIARRKKRHEAVEYRLAEVSNRVSIITETLDKLWALVIVLDTKHSKKTSKKI